jgi:predicted extracellular nuclease
MRAAIKIRMLRRLSTALAIALVLGTLASTVAPLTAVSTSVVISQVYGGGGNAGATFKNDFIELYNRGAVAVNLTGWSVQYASSTGATWQVTNLTSVTLQPGHYYLVQEAVGAGGTMVLPTPDAIGTIAMSATAGKVALVNATTALSGACPAAASFVDFVGYGAANCSETAPTAGLSNLTAALRAGNGATDTDNNLSDFTVGAPNPRNTSVGDSTPPSGVGSTSPVAVNPGEQILLKVAVTPGTNPTSAGITVSGDLSSLSGSPSQQFFDDGSNGDVAAGDNIFSYLFTTSVASAVGSHPVHFVVADNLARSTAGDFDVTLQASGPQDVVISQVYGGGGNAGATYKNDFIELFNRGTTAVGIAGWTVQYASAAGATWTTTALSGTLNPGQYYLVQEAAGSGGTTSLPAPDAVGNISLAATAGKVALVKTATALSGACPADASIVDLVGFGATATCFEGGGPAPAPASTTAARRSGGSGGCTDSNNNNADFFVGAPIPRNSSITGNCTVADALPLAIHDIQGSTNTSVYAGQNVLTSGVVTARKNNGFFLQAPDAEADTNPDTSEGIFVFTSSAPPVQAAVASYVSVTATVQEFIPNADPNSPSVTELIGPVTVTLLTPDYGLPAPVIITPADASAAGGIYNLEKFEGMRVSIPSLTVVAPTDGTTNEAAATSTSTGVFYGVITGVARPMREPGVQVPDPLPAGSPAGVPRFDANPERIRVDSDVLPGTVALNVATGAVVTGLIGPLDYSFRSYTVLPESVPGPTVTNNDLAAVPVPVAGAHEFTVASFNMERFFDTVNDPAKDDVALTPLAFANRLNKASLAIRNVLRTPDVIGVEEMENLTTLQAVAAKVSADAIAAGQPDPDYDAILLEGNDIGGIDVGFLVRRGRVTIDGAAEQIGLDATYLPPGSSTPALLNDRPSLLVRAIVHVPGANPFPVTIVVNHLRSLSGVDDPVDGGRVRAKRRAQAEYLANYIQARQSANPDEHLVLVGDFNAFAFNDGYVDVIGTIKGTPTPSDEVVLASFDLVNPDLVNLVETVPADQRYSFVFDGIAQELDHVLVTPNVQLYLSRFEYARNDADFPEVFRNDPNRPERISDHDMVVAYFAIPFAVMKCDANGDGSVTSADLLIIRNANGQAASGPDDPRDGNSDGSINIADVRYCQLRLAR